MRIRGLGRARAIWNHLFPTRERLRRLELKNEFLLHELRNIQERFRTELAKDDLKAIVQTKGSFDFQWNEFNTGTGLSDDKDFISGVAEHICKITQLPPDWFKGKRVADVGCGAGRFTYGLLSLGANVHSFDQSQWALKRTRDLCEPFKDRLTTERIDLLTWDSVGEFDLVFSFGVVHHTGNTYRAIRNACSKVGKRGKLFLMIYGIPETPGDFMELNAYERLREELRNLPFRKKQDILIERFGRDAHGWFDAVSPKINDLLGFQEVVELLGGFGFGSVRKTLDCRNLHVMADRVETPSVARTAPMTEINA